LKHVDHKPLSAAPTAEGYNKKDKFWAAKKKYFKHFNKSWPMVDLALILSAHTSYYIPECYLPNFIIV
jgi:hypothetical protein